MANLQETEKLDEEIFSFVRKTEDEALKAARDFTEALREWEPVELPVVHRFLDGIFDFTDKVMKTQREFARKMVHESRVMADRLDKGPPEARTQATHRAVTTPHAKRTAA